MNKMKAASLFAVGDLRYIDMEVPNCKDDEVLVKIKNCGICGSDVGRVLHKGTYHFPTVPGHEFSGVIIFDPQGKDEGKRVAVYPLLPCFKCDECANERYAQCRNYDYYGSRRDGGYAEYISVKRFNLIFLPDNVSFEEGAMCEPVSVALAATKKLEIKKGDNLLIIGAGPIGLMVGMWAQSFGADKIYYSDIDSNKLDFVKKFGFYVFNGEKVDKVLEGSGAGSGVICAVNAVEPFGRIVLMGNPSGAVTIDPSTWQNILRKEIILKGTWNSSFSQRENDWKESVNAISDGKLKLRGLITHRVAIKDVFSAIKMMAEHKEFYCKVMIDNER